MANLPQRGEHDCRGGVIAAAIAVILVFSAIKAGFDTGFFDFWISFFQAITEGGL